MNASMLRSEGSRPSVRTPSIHSSIILKPFSSHLRCLSPVVLHHRHHRVLVHARLLQGLHHGREVVVKLLQHGQVLLPRLALGVLGQELEPVQVLLIGLQGGVHALGGQVQEQGGAVAAVFLGVGPDRLGGLAREQLGRVGAVGGEIGAEVPRVGISRAPVPCPGVGVVVRGTDDPAVDIER